MKSRNLLTYLLLPVLLFGFASCSDDDEEDNNSINWNDIAGSYTGTLTLSMQYASLTFPDQTIVLSKGGSNTANLSYSGDCGSFEFTSIAVTANSDGSYSIGGDGTFNMQMSAEYLEQFGMSGAGVSTGVVSGYACLVSGTISSKTDYELTLTLPSVMGGTTLTFRNDTATE